MGPGTGTAGRLNLSELAGFQPKQLAAWYAARLRKFVMFGGARGPGKSYWLRWALLLYLLYAFLRFNQRGVRVGLFTETYPELRDRQINRIAVEFPVWMGDVRESQEHGLGFHLRGEYGGGVLALRNLDRPEKYQGAEWAAIGIDEITQTLYTTFTVLRGSLRWPGIDWNPFLVTGNPGGVGHGWVKRLWVDGEMPPELAGREAQFELVPALPGDNVYLTEAYWQELRSLPEPLRSAWLLGRWDVFEGMAFAGWNPLRHVVPSYVLPSHWPRWRAIDYGLAAPWCCLWFAKEPGVGRIHVYREAYQAGLSDRDQAEAIKALTGPGENITLTWADPSMWARKSVREIVTSTADEYATMGVPLTPADNDRLSGKRKVDRVLGNLPDGLPMLVVHDCCVNLIRTLPALPRSEKNPEDVDTKSEDHAYDALRYGLTAERDAVADLAAAAKQQQLIRPGMDAGYL